MSDETRAAAGSPVAQVILEGNFVFWTPGDGSGYRVFCTNCGWRKNYGCYIWSQQNAAKKHVCPTRCESCGQWVGVASPEPGAAEKEADNG